MVFSTLGSSVYGILQARILECLAVSFCRGSSQPRDWTCISCITAAAKSLQSCPILWDPIDGSPPGSSVPGILQARILEWVAISFSNACMHAKSLQSCLTLCDPMDSSHEAPPSTEFSRQEYWSGLPFPSPLLHYRWILYRWGIREAQSYLVLFHNPIIRVIAIS